MLKSIALFALATASMAFIAGDSPQKFDMTDPKGVSGLSFTIESELEPIIGTTSAISGEIVIDEKSPEKSTGKLVIQTASVRTASDGMTSAMQGEWCLAPKKYPTIEFAVTKVSGLKKLKDNSYRCRVAGDFSFHGVTKPVIADAQVTKVSNAIGRRGGMEGKDGDLLVVRGSFTFNRRDFNVAPDLSSELVGDLIEVRIATVGVSPKP